VESVARRSESPRFALELAVAEATLQLGPGAGADAPIRVAASAARPEAVHESVLPPRAVAASTVEDLPARAAKSPPPPAPEPDGVREVAANFGPPPFDEPPPFDQDPYPIEPPNRRSTAAGPVRVPAERSAPAANRDENPVEAPGSQNAPDGASWVEVLRWLQRNGTASVHQCAQKAVRGAVTAEQEVLTVPFLPTDKFAVQMLDRGANRQAIEQAVREIYGGRWVVRCVTISETRSAGDADNQARNYLDEIAAEFTGGRIGPAGA
jgi:hypothetical protein